MAEVTREKFLNRNTIKQFLSDGKQVVICRGEHNPVAYYDDNLILREQDVKFGQESYTQSVSGLWLKKKSKISVGVRLDGQLQKYLGLRPDIYQDGSEGIEFGIENIKINDKTVNVSLADRATKITDTVDKYSDDICIFTARNCCRQLLKVTNEVRGFTITYRVDIKGLDVIYKNEIDEWWFYSKKTKEFRFRIRKPLLIDATTFEPLKIDGVDDIKSLLKHSLVLQPDGSYLYTKESVVDLGEYKLPAEFYIDAETAYTTTKDGYIYYASAVSWAAAYSQTTGTTADDNNTTDNVRAVKSGSTYYIYRIWLYYDASAVAGTIESVGAVFWCYIYNAAGNVGLQKGTQSDTLVTGDFDLWTGSTYGYASFTANKSNTISLNSTGITDVQAGLGGTIKMCFREYDHDYSNSAPTTNPGYTEIRMGDYADTTYDPQLSITMVAAGQPAAKRMVNVKHTPFYNGGR